MEKSSKRIWGWMFYDFATQPYYTLLLTFIFGPYIVGVAEVFFLENGLDIQKSEQMAQIVWANTHLLVGLCIAFIAPFWGYFCQKYNVTRSVVVGSLSISAVCSGLLWLAYPDGSTLYTSLSLLAIVLIVVGLSQVSIDAQLIDISEKEGFGKLSGFGFAFGYFGGILSLVIMLSFFAQNPEGKTILGSVPPFGLAKFDMGGTRFVGPFCALWLVIFILPYLYWVLWDDEKKQPSH